MKNPYQKLMDEIHVPAGLNDRVLSAARQPRRTNPWFRTAVCAACALALILGTVRFTAPQNPAATPPSGTLPHWEFTLTACAADTSSGSSNLSFAVEQSGAAEGCCLFQIQSKRAVSVRLSMQQGELYVVEKNDRLEPLKRAADNAPLDYSLKERFGFRLTDTVGFLTVEVSFPDGSTSCKTYGLIAESPEESNEASDLHTPLFYHDARPVSQRVRAVDETSRRQLRWPLDTAEKQITCPYGTSSPASSFFHPGIDIAAPVGTSILAVADGKVVEIGTDQTDGRYLVLDHGNGLTTRYHNCSALTVELDDPVKAGEKIAQVGNTGRSTGPHLHFEVRDNAQCLDPKLYFDPETLSQLN